MCQVLGWFHWTVSGHWWDHLVQKWYTLVLQWSVVQSAWPVGTGVVWEALAALEGDWAQLAHPSGLDRGTGGKEGGRGEAKE